MIAFKVHFANNKAAKAEQLKTSQIESVKVARADGRTIVEWLTIYADTEQESMTIANKVVKDYFIFV